MQVWSFRVARVMLLTPAPVSATLRAHSQKWITGFMLRTLLFSVLLGAALVPRTQAQTSNDGICVIGSVSGASVVSAPGFGRSAAETGLGLGRNATLRTGPEARVSLLCDGNLRVEVGPDTELLVQRLLQEEPRIFGMRLLDGIVGFVFGAGNDGSGVQVRTPSAVAAVRSTEWAMQVTDGASAVFAREGTVFVSGETGTVRLGPGEGVDVTAGGSVGPVVEWGQTRLDLVSELLGPGW